MPSRLLNSPNRRRFLFAPPSIHSRFILGGTRFLLPYDSRGRRPLRCFLLTVIQVSNCPRCADDEGGARVHGRAGPQRNQLRWEEAP